MLKIFITIPLLLLFTGFAWSQNEPEFQLNQANQELLNTCLSKVSSDSIYNYIQELSGMETRYTYASNRKEVAEWIAAKFRSFGYEQVYLEPYHFYSDNNYNEYTDQYNVVCIRQGTSENQIIIGAHHDAVQPSPGADDNASGTAGVLEIARVLQQQHFSNQYTLKFVTFSAEEVGLVGSNYSAQESIFSGDSVCLMLNMDMISNSPTDSLADVKIIYKTSDNPFYHLTNYVAQSFSGMQPHSEAYASNSDQHSYVRLKIPALFFHEYIFSPYYHSKNDKLENINSVYASRVLKTVMGTVLAYDMLPSLPKPQLIQTGDGRSVTLNWSEQPNHITTQVYLASSSNNFELYYEGKQNKIPVSPLNPDSIYHVLIRHADEFDNYASSMVDFKTDSIPATPSNIALYGLSDRINITWDKNPEEDILGYRVYEYKNGQNYLKNNEPALVPYFSDQSVNDELYHYYRISAIDSHGNEGALSVAKGTRLKHDFYLEDSIETIVIIDIGGIPNLEESTKTFFENILHNQENYILTLRNGELVSQDLLFHSKNVIWCTPVVKQNASALGEQIEVLEQFIRSGGNLFLTTSDPNQALAGFMRLMPTQFGNSELNGKSLNIKEINFISGSYLSTIETIHPSAPDLQLNLDAIPDEMKTGNYLNFVQSITPNQFGTPAYTYVAPESASSEQLQMNGTTIGFFSPNLAALSIPLSFFDEISAKNLTDFVFNHLFINTQINESITSSPIQVFPNPAQSVIQVNTNELATIRLYSQFGELVFTEHHISNGTPIDISGIKKGMYVVSVSTKNQTHYSKLVKW